MGVEDWMKHYEDKWFQSFGMNEIHHVRSHERDMGLPIPSECIDIVIPIDYIHSLVEFLIKHGYVRPLINNESREQDVKIIHRLLDVLDK